MLARTSTRRAKSTRPHVGQAGGGLVQRVGGLVQKSELSAVDLSQRVRA